MKNSSERSEGIGFDVLNKDKGAVVLKRVLPTTNRRRQAHAETFLPKLSVHYFEVRDVERLQSLAAEISERQRQAKNSTGYRRMLNILKLT